MCRYGQLDSQLIVWFCGAWSTLTVYIAGYTVQPSAYYIQIGSIWLIYMVKHGQRVHWTLMKVAQSSSSPNRKRKRCWIYSYILVWSHHPHRYDIGIFENHTLLFVLALSIIVWFFVFFYDCLIFFVSFYDCFFFDSLLLFMVLWFFISFYDCLILCFFLWLFDSLFLFMILCFFLWLFGSLFLFMIFDSLFLFCFSFLPLNVFINGFIKCFHKWRLLKASLFRTFNL